MPRPTHEASCVNSNMENTGLNKLHTGQGGESKKKKTRKKMKTHERAAESAYQSRDVDFPGVNIGHLHQKRISYGFESLIRPFGKPIDCTASHKGRELPKTRTKDLSYGTENEKIGIVIYSSIFEQEIASEIKERQNGGGG